MRQTHGSVMLSNASKIRDAVERKSFIEFSLDEGKDCIAENIDLLAPYYRLSEKKPSVKAAVIAYSNKQALDYNLAIRRHYYGDAAPRLKAGDLLMICRNSYAYEYELFNGNIIQIEACQPDSEVTTRSIRVKLGKNRIEQVELRFRRAVICFAVRGKRVSLNVTLLDNFLTDSSGSIGGLLASALIVDFNNRLPQNIKSRLSEIRRLLRSKEKLTIEQQEIRDKYIQLLKNDPFYNAVVAKYGYAMTCHKAQGGEWENVFVDMGRFGGTANEDYFRWAYTAITRASKKLYHFRSPDFNYISGLVVEPVSLVANLKVSIHEDSEDFKTSRFSRIKTLAMKAGLDVEENLSVNYQHRVTFTNPDGEFASYSLWYNKKGYSNKEILVKSSSEEMKSLTSGLLEESLFSGDVRPNFQDRPFADKLTQFLMSLFTEYDITLLDITKDQYQDIFHLKTDGFAKMTFYYTAKGNYSYVRLQSTLGNDDSNLNLIRQSLI
ncbi:MAG: ATP-binding domain-containing protein [Muribaculaceae bacterium]|nr:ATP-binding domain-containing protein [Muribaculaceae bacterium]